MPGTHVQRSWNHLTALCAGFAIGGGAVVVSRWHVLPPLQCFALLVVGLVTLGATVYVAAKWYLPMAAPRMRTVKPAAATRGVAAARARRPPMRIRP